MVMERTFFSNRATYVGDVSIHVTNLNNSLDFYQNIIGFHILERNERKVVLTADGKTSLLTLEEPEKVLSKQVKTTGLYHFALLLPTRADLASFLMHCLQQNVQLGASDHLVSEALYLSDPDGNGIEVYSDRLSSAWEWINNQVTMATEPLEGEGLLAELKSPWMYLPNKTVMGHIHLHVAHLEEAKQFYVEGLGFNVVSNYPGALFISTANYHHHIGLNIWNGEGAPAPENNSVGLKLFTLVYPDKQTLDDAIDRLKASEVKIKEENNGYLVEDPSKNLIHLRK
ncbi:catechol 2,3-dioxygenase [Virgibacillus salarius]